MCALVTGVQTCALPISELLTSTRDNAEQQARIYRIIGLMDQWREEIANVEINEIQEGQNGEASTLIATGRGKQLTDVIQAQIKQAADTETALLAIRNDVLSDQQIGRAHV